MARGGLMKQGLVEHIQSRQVGYDEDLDLRTQMASMICAALLPFLVVFGPISGESVEAAAAAVPSLSPAPTAPATPATELKRPTR